MRMEPVKRKQAPQFYKQHITKFYQQHENLEADSLPRPLGWVHTNQHLDFSLERSWTDSWGPNLVQLLLLAELKNSKWVLFWVDEIVVICYSSSRNLIHSFLRHKHSMIIFHLVNLLNSDHFYTYHTKITIISFILSMPNLFFPWTPELFFFFFFLWRASFDTFLQEKECLKRTLFLQLCLKIILINPWNKLIENVSRYRILAWKQFLFRILKSSI